MEYGVKPRVADAQQPKHLGRTLRLAKAIKVVVGEQDSWQGTASQLLALIGPGKSGIPKDAGSLSTQIMKPHITDALKTYGITVQRKRTPTKRLLQLSHSVTI